MGEIGSRVIFQDDDLYPKCHRRGGVDEVDNMTKFAFFQDPSGCFETTEVCMAQERQEG